MVLRAGLARFARSARLALCVPILFFLAGCRPTPRPVEDRVLDLELALSRLDQRLAAATTAEIGSGTLGLTKVPPAPEPDPRADERVVDLEARLSALEAQVGLLAELLRQTEGRPLDPRPAGPRRIGTDAPAPAGPRVTFIDAAPAGRAPPPAGQPVEVLAAGAGDALLVRGPAGLEKVVLAGVEAPLTAQAYTTDAAARERHTARLSPAAIASDAAYERSRARLEALVAGGRATLVYPPGGPVRRGGALVARVTVPGSTPTDPPVDLAEWMAREGLVLAGEGDAERAPALETLESEARAAGRGLFQR